MDNFGINVNMSCIYNNEKWKVGFHAEDSTGHDINIELDSLDDIEDCFDILINEVIEAIAEDEEEYDDWDDIEDIDDYITEILEENRALREEIEMLKKLQPTEEKCEEDYSEKINELTKTIEYVQKIFNSNDFGKSLWSSIVLK